MPDRPVGYKTIKYDMLFRSGERDPYYHMLDDRMIFIGGSGRSGTSWLGKVIGSCAYVYYDYEPFTFKIALIMGMPRELLYTFVFEGCALPCLLGQHVNFMYDPALDISGHNYISDLEIADWNDKKHNRYDDMEELIERKDPFKRVAIKHIDITPYYSMLLNTFKGSQIVHIVRNGNDVIASSLKLNWFTDERYAFDFGWPGWVDDLSQFLKFKPATRAAVTWRTMNDPCFLKDINCMRYEDIMPDDSHMLDIPGELGLQETVNTKRHMSDFKPVDHYPSVLDEIEQPERDKFCEMMEYWKYDVS